MLLVSRCFTPGICLPSPPKTLIADLAFTASSKRSIALVGGWPAGNDWPCFGVLVCNVACAAAGTGQGAEHGTDGDRGDAPRRGLASTRRDGSRGRSTDGWMTRIDMTVTASRTRRWDVRYSAPSLQIVVLVPTLVMSGITS